jgi:hypothetical protein
MQMLFAISIICFLVAVWAGVAVVRRIRIRTNQQPDRTSSSRRINFSQHLYSAVEDQNSIEPRKVPHQTLRDITAKKDWNQSPDAVTAGSKHQMQTDPQQSVSELVERKPPQSSYRAGSERLDWAYFNKDLSDLSDLKRTSRLRANTRNSPKHL